MSAQSHSQAITQITAAELAQRIASADEPLQLIDVREPEELAAAQIEHFLNLPLSQFAAWSPTLSTQLDPHAETIVLCHHGVRSAQMCQWLVHQGFTNVKNVMGGIEAYAVTVDPTVPRY